MKQPDLKRKALSLLIAPFALGALPAAAVTLDATHYAGYGEFYEATDAEGNRMFFYAPFDTEICRFIGAETSNSQLTLPETIRIRVDEEMGGG